MRHQCCACTGHPRTMMMPVCRRCICIQARTPVRDALSGRGRSIDRHRRRAHATRYCVSTQDHAGGVCEVVLAAMRGRRADGRGKRPAQVQEGHGMVVLRPHSAWLKSGYPKAPAAPCVLTPDASVLWPGGRRCGVVRSARFDLSGRCSDYMLCRLGCVAYRAYRGQQQPDKAELNAKRAHHEGRPEPHCPPHGSPH